MRPPGARYGSDVIVDLLVEAGIEAVAFNPGATFRGIHDSLVNYRDDAPRVVLCLHEAIGVAVAQGYAKAAGRPMATALHDVVGLQNASMAIYNAWCDRTPVLLLGGTGPMSKARRRPWIDWIHTASAQAEIVRDYVKWDDQPADLESVPESFARALHTAVSAPPGPVYLCYDVDLQEAPLPARFVAEGIDRYATPTEPAASAADLDWLVGILREAARPVVLAGHAGASPQAFRGLVDLAECAAAAVVDTPGRFSFPSAHALNVTGLPDIVDDADVVIALEVEDLRGGFPRAVGNGSVPGTATVVNVTTGHLRAGSWSHDYQALPPATRHITATGDAVVAGLLQRLRADPPDASAVQQRRGRLSAEVGAQRSRRIAAARAATDDAAVPLERLVHELGAALGGRRFVLANGTNDRLEHRLWDLADAGQALGWHGGGGLGYGVGASIGAALAAAPGVVTVDVQADGDLLYTPSALWTLAHLRLPVLMVVYNNRQYGNTVEHAASIARARSRATGTRYVGAGLTDPPVDIASLARSFGIWAVGPVTTPDVLAASLEGGLDVVDAGAPALIDVVTRGF